MVLKILKTLGLILILDIIKFSFTQRDWNIDPDEPQQPQPLDLHEEQQISGGKQAFDVTKFGCSEDLPINTVRHEEMNDDNYLRYSII